MRLKAIPCPGEAHRNPRVDNCGICAPLWGEIVVPYEYPEDSKAVGFAVPRGVRAFNRAKAKFIRNREAALRALGDNASKCCGNASERAELASAIASELSRGAK